MIEPVLTLSRFSGLPPKGAGEVPMIVLNAEDAADRGPVPEWAQPYAGDRSSLLFRPRSGWTRKNPPNTIERAHVLLGGTVDSMRVLEIHTAVSQSEIGSWHVIGKGEAGILGAYAALLDPRIKRVTVVDPPSSHREGPLFLSVLRVCDIPEALGCLAPRPLTIVGGKREVFDRTAEIYRIAGAADKLERK